MCEEKRGGKEREGRERKCVRVCERERGRERERARTRDREYVCVCARVAACERDRDRQRRIHMLGNLAFCLKPNLLVGCSDDHLRIKDACQSVFIISRVLEDLCFLIIKVYLFL